MSIFSYISAGAAGQDQQTIKSGQGPGRQATLFGVEAFNTNSGAARFLKIYNKPDPTAADTPVLRYAIPAAPAAGGVAGVVSKFAVPEIVGGTALSIRITSGLADNDVGAVGAGDVVVNIEFM